MSRIDAKTSLKGQTTIPVEVRRLIGLEPGGSVRFVTTEDGEVRVVAKKKSLAHLKGLFGPLDAPLDVDYLIAELNAAAGASPTVTFDRKAGLRDPFSPLS